MRWRFTPSTFRAEAPRYLAAPGAWSMPLVLTEIGLLTSGGMTGMLRKG